MGGDYCGWASAENAVVTALDFRNTAVSAETAVAIATDFRGLPWLVQRSSPHGQHRGTCCGKYCGLPRTCVEIAANRRIAVVLAADGRAWPWNVAEFGRPRKLP